MAQLVVLYKSPQDAKAFDTHYFEQHVPLAKTIKGLRRYEVSAGPVTSPAGASGIHLVAILHFDTTAAIHEAFTSPEGKAAAADVRTFATGGVDMLLFDTKDV